MRAAWSCRGAPRPAGVPIVFAAIAALVGCVPLRSVDHPPAPPVAPSASREPPPDTAANPSAPPPATPTQPANEPAAPPQSTQLPPCLPVGPTPPPRPKMQAKAVRKASSPPLSTVSVDAQTPPRAAVDAQVQRLPVAVTSILGKRVQGAHGEDLGRVVDVLADASGRVRVAIVDFGGFLGVGNHRVAVDWPLLKFNPDEHDPSLLLGVSFAKVKSAPEYKEDARPQTLMEPAAEAAAEDPKRR